MQALYAMIDLLEEEEEKDELKINFNSVKKTKNIKINKYIINHKLKKYLDF